MLKRTPPKKTNKQTNKQKQKQNKKTGFHVWRGYRVLGAKTQEIQNDEHMLEIGIKQISPD